jgi:hypothetical protein
LMNMLFIFAFSLIAPYGGAASMLRG